MKAVVTGATGFVGGHVVDRLLTLGHQVTALVRSPSRAQPLADRGVQLVKGDLADLAALDAAFQGQDVIFHVAALTGAGDETSLQAANRAGTVAVVDAAARVPSLQRIVLVSSMAAGGPSELGQPNDGSGPDRPVTMYGRSKLASELALRSAAVPWTILRPPTVYGPGDRQNLLAVFRAARTGFAPVFGDGSMPVSMVHVVDLADAIVRAGDAPAVVGRTFYVNHPEVVSTAELVRAIGRQVGRKVTLVPLPRWVARSALTVTGAWAAVRKQQTILHPDKVHEFFQPAWTGDPAQFIAATGWQPEFDLERGLADTAAWYRGQGLL